jgi:hypothetical protein
VAAALLPATTAGASSDAATIKTHVKVCSDPGPGYARCLAHRRTDAGATQSRPAAGRKPVAQPNVLGNSGAYDPAYLQSAYNLKSAASSAGAGQTVAIVDAYDDPWAASDLSSYRSYFGVGAASFRKVNQSGNAGPYPAFDNGWAQEISLDLDMVSAICPKCNILLVEANSASYSDLATAVNTAAALGATVISNSYGGGESSAETGYDTSAYCAHPGVAITVSSGDSGYGVQYPAASRCVTAVGGTSLNQLSNTGSRNATETAWSGAGSGCSAYEQKPAWQTDAGCTRRTVADVAAVADPNTGVWVYYGAWYVFGGTSVASPIIGSVYALTGNASSSPANPYNNAGSLFDITSGSNGSCGGSYLCTAGTGYDGPTGLGTPNGAGAFTSAPLPALNFTSAPQSLTAGGSPVALQLATATGTAQATLSSSSSHGSFSASASGPWTSSLLVPVPSTGTTAYYQDTLAGSPTLTATATGYNGTTQVETVTPAALATIWVSPASATVPLGGTRTFSATGQDTYGNAVSINPSWTVGSGTPGSVPPSATGSSVAFTASSTATGPGSVIATDGATSGYASVNVVAQSFSLAVSPQTRTVRHGYSTTYTVSITRTGGFTGAVTLGSSCPGRYTSPYVSCSFSQSPATGGTVTLTVRTYSSTTRGTLPQFTVTGTSSGLPASSASFTLTVI